MAKEGAIPNIKQNIEQISVTGILFSKQVPKHKNTIGKIEL